MLIHKLADEKFLREAWDSLKKINADSHGLSGETISEFRQNQDNRIKRIFEELKAGKYIFQNTRAFLIPKDKGKHRPLQIPEISDRIVLKGMAILLEERLRDYLKIGTGVSFAYQKRLGVREAVEKMQKYYHEGYHYILEADIKQFFPSVNKELLLTELFSHFPEDTSLNSLIISGLSQELGGLEFIDKQLLHYFAKSSLGIPQGNPLSPLLSNFFLTPFDRQMKEAGFALIRYADDFIVMCKTKDEAGRIFAKAKEILEGQLQLELHPLGSDKSKIVNPKVDKDFSFLSVSFDGKHLFPSKKSVDRFIRNLEKICNEKNRDYNVRSMLSKVNNSLDGWISSYFYTDVERYFKEIDAEIDMQLHYGLKKLDWTLSKKGKVKSKFRKKKEGRLDSGECLSVAQRQSSGIPLCMKILLERRGIPKVGPVAYINKDLLTQKVFEDSGVNENVPWSQSEIN